MPKPLITIIVLLSAVMALGMLLIFLGKTEMAAMVGTFGSHFVLIGAIFYIVLFHSKQRWPDLSTWQRFEKLCTQPFVR